MMDFLSVAVAKVGAFIATIAVLFVLVGLGPLALIWELHELGIPVSGWMYPVFMFVIFFALDGLTNGALTRGWRRDDDDEDDE